MCGCVLCVLWFAVMDAMMRTTADLLTTFNAVTGYTQSDEISLVFPSLDSLVTEENKGTLLVVVVDIAIIICIYFYLQQKKHRQRADFDVQWKDSKACVSHVRILFGSVRVPVCYYRSTRRGAFQFLA